MNTHATNEKPFCHITLNTRQVAELAKIMGLITVECTDPKILGRHVVITGCSDNNHMILRFDENEEGLAKILPCNP